MESKTAAVVSCWIAVAVISSVYMLAFANKISDALGILLPVGLLVLVAFVFSIFAMSNSHSTTATN